MEMVPWRPFEAISRVLGDDWWEIELPATDMYEEGGNLVVETSLPRFTADEIEVDSTDSDLEITAQHKEKNETKGRNYYLHESEGTYWRRVHFPEGIKAGNAVSKFEHGILTVKLPIVIGGETKRENV